MKIATLTITNDTIARGTKFRRDWVDDHIKTAERLKDDPDYLVRVVAQQCLACFYLTPFVAGAAMTDRECGICNDLMHFSSTDTNNICDTCAKKHDLCVHCASDIDLKNRKREL